MKTLAGGLITIFVAAMMAKITIENAYWMVLYDSPKYEQVESRFKNFDEKIYLSEVTKTVLEIMEGNGPDLDSVYKTVELN